MTALVRQICHEAYQSGYTQLESGYRKINDWYTRTPSLDVFKNNIQQTVIADSVSSSPHRLVPLIEKIEALMIKGLFYTGLLLAYRIQAGVVMISMVIGAIEPESVQQINGSICQIWKNIMAKRQYPVLFPLAFITLAATPLCTALYAFCLGSHYGSKLAGNQKPPSQKNQPGTSASSLDLPV